jgi:hypothetical protein
MAQITSREELEEWLKDKPRGWALVIAARAALRVVPYAFTKRVLDERVATCSLALFRAPIILWAASDFLAHELRRVVYAASSAYSAAFAAKGDVAFAASVHAAYAISAAADGDDSSVAMHADAMYVEAALAVADAVNASLYSAVDAAYHTDTDTDTDTDADADAASAAVYANVNHDCDWLTSEGKVGSASRLLTHGLLWPASEPKGWSEAWAFAIERLAALNQGYQVWIDWYNRRIEGHDAAFDIPGDIDRTHDKAILARLADASDEDFWGKGATYVNTTLQRWIDEARLTAELESVTRKLEFGAVTQFGSLQARETLAAFRAKLDYAVGNQPPAHAPIGHNQPPEGIDPGEAPILPPAIREEAKAVLAMLDQPDRDSALETAKTLTRWSKIKSTYRHDKFSENFSGELGTSMARGIVFILTSLCLLGLAWLKAVLGI